MTIKRRFCNIGGVLSALIVLTASIALAQPLADYGDAPENDELLFCTGPGASNYPSRFASNGPFYTVFTDVWLGWHPNTETFEPDATLPNCDDWVAPPFDEDDGPLVLCILTNACASGWLPIPLDGGTIFGPPPIPTPGTHLAIWLFKVSIDAGAPSPDDVPRFANVVVDSNANGVYGDPGEWVVVNAPVTALPGTTEIMVTGAFPVNTVLSPTPPGWAIAPFWSRFLVSRTPIATPTWDGSRPAGDSSEGEVEDWLVIGDPGEPVRYDFPTVEGTIEITNIKTGNTENVPLTGTASVAADYKQIADKDGDGLEQIPTEIVALELTGNSELIRGQINVRLRSPEQHPNQRSVGEIEEKRNNFRGVPEYPPFFVDPADGTFKADSFFDVFFEIVPQEHPRKTMHNDIPKRIGAQISGWPPLETFGDGMGESIPLSNERERTSRFAVGALSLKLLGMPHPPPTGTPTSSENSDSE